MNDQGKSVEVIGQEDSSAIASFIVNQIIELLQKEGALQGHEVCTHQVHD